MVGRGGASSGLLLKELVEERAQFVQVGKTESCPTLGGEEIGIKRGEVGPGEGDAQGGAVGGLEENPVETGGGATEEER